MKQKVIDELEEAALERFETTGQIHLTCDSEGKFERQQKNMGYKSEGGVIITVCVEPETGMVSPRLDYDGDKCLTTVEMIQRVINPSQCQQQERDNCQPNGDYPLEYDGACWTPKLGIWISNVTQFSIPCQWNTLEDTICRAERKIFRWGAGTEI